MRFPGFHATNLIHRRAACATSNEALHTRSSPCLALSPRSPARTARRGEVERTVTSGPLRVKHFPGPPSPDSPPCREHRGASLGGTLQPIDNEHERERLRGLEAAERSAPDRGSGPDRALGFGGVRPPREVLSPKTGESIGGSAPRSYRRPVGAHRPSNRYLDTRGEQDILRTDDRGTSRSRADDLLAAAPVMLEARFLRSTVRLRQGTEMDMESRTPGPALPTAPDGE